VACDKERAKRLRKKQYPSQLPIEGYKQPVYQTQKTTKYIDNPAIDSAYRALALAILAPILKAEQKMKQMPTIRLKAPSCTVCPHCGSKDDASSETCRRCGKSLTIILGCAA
jgi:hypothetical protein